MWVALRRGFRYSTRGQKDVERKNHQEAFCVLWRWTAFPHRYSSKASTGRLAELLALKVPLSRFDHCTLLSRQRFSYGCWKTQFPYNFPYKDKLGIRKALKRKYFWTRFWIGIFNGGGCWKTLLGFRFWCKDALCEKRWKKPLVKSSRVKQLRFEVSEKTFEFLMLPLPSPLLRKMLRADESPANCMRSVCVK